MRMILPDVYCIYVLCLVLMLSFMSIYRPIQSIGKIYKLNEHRVLCFSMHGAQIVLAKCTHGDHTMGVDIRNLGSYIGID